MKVKDLISYTDAAREIGCSRSTLYRAAEDGRLNDLEVGGRRMIVKDEAWKGFDPNVVGRRAQKLENQDNDTDSNSE